MTDKLTTDTNAYERHRDVEDLMPQTLQRAPLMPEVAAHHKFQRSVLKNNLFVQISKQYPMLPRSKRKRMADKIARSRVAEFVEKGKSEKEELRKLQEQDYRELRAKDRKELTMGKEIK